MAHSQNIIIKCLICWIGSFDFHQVAIMRFPLSRSSDCFIGTCVCNCSSWSNWNTQCWDKLFFLLGYIVEQLTLTKPRYGRQCPRWHSQPNTNVSCSVTWQSTFGRKLFRMKQTLYKRSSYYVKFGIVNNSLKYCWFQFQLISIIYWGGSWNGLTINWLGIPYTNC